MLKSEGSTNGPNWSEPEEDFDYDEDDSEQQLFMDANHILEILDEEEEEPVQPQHIPEDLFLKDGVDTQIGAPGPYAKNFYQPQDDSEHPYGDGLTSGTNLSEDSQNSNPNNHSVNNVHLTNSTLSGSSGRLDDVSVAPDQLNQISAYPKNGYEYGDPGYAWLSKPTLEDQSYCQNSDEAFPIRGTFFCDDGFQNVASDMDGSPLSEQGCEKLVSHSEDLVDLTLSDSENEHEPARTKPQFPSYGENIELSRGFKDPSVSSKLAWMKNNRGFDIGPYVASDGEAGVLTRSNIISADSIGTSVGDLNPLSMKRLSTSSLDISQHSQGRIHDVRQLNQEHSCHNFRVGEVDDDAELYVIEDISSRNSIAMPTFDRQSVSTLQHYPAVASFHGTESGVERLRINDERLTYRLALQNLSQARSETNPPDGVLTVPLLKHQRIALSWMVEKETASLHCSGGILADDQGLGKTISTIALILMERSPNSSIFVEDVKQQTEALDLDEDEEVLEPEDVKQIIQSSDEGSNKRPKRNWKSFEPCKGRPSAGTLVVCPTSVLRQWGEELQNKVTDKAKLTVLIYHGSNRSRDPCEIAKYDVVITTYAIVSMEVPKQPLVDQDGNEEGYNYLSSEPSSSKKRKNYNDKKTNGKIQKASDGCLSESFDRPLAKVKWFRVVLDEAQSIKNHRTQVARACWGLRAKRRWCLSGTPIQNAIDDLYSYFRFLRYEPYAVYKLFCSNIKIPISKDPSNGYKKLQAVLKTVMLRRTKGTVLDGEPIIKLPPKFISLKKVKFSAEERLFYCRLEAESKAQFKVYADAGTVQQNYVNILLMLLRLRQACDHPVLVKYRDSDSADKSSLELTRKLPRERLIDLVTHLDAAICGICSDPPEDAVVTICGHVFCNQCVHQHLSSDDNLCPSANCKIQLNSSSIFSRATLFLSLSGDIAPDDAKESASKVSDDHSFQSSKIKAALEILQSLPKLSEQQFKSTRECFSSEVNSEAAYASKLEDSCVTAQPQTDSTDSDGSGTSYAHSMTATEKAIVFSQWTRMLDLLEAHLKKSGIKYRRLDGTMSVLARDKAVKDFNTLPEVSVMIMSLKAASLGLNMVAACHVLLLDLWWNPTTEDQAIDRAHRIGQTRPVIVSRLTVEGTVEDRILALQDKKREMVASAFGEDEKGRHQTRLTVEDLNYLFMGGGRG